MSQPEPAPRLSRDREQVAHLESLTSLRFLAALLVFGNHAGDAFLPPASRLNSFLQTGWVGVSFFFVLSGFVLTWSSRSDCRLRFYRRRAARIMPNHVVTWTIALVMLLGTGASVGVTGALASLTLLHAWHPSEARSSSLAYSLPSRFAPATGCR